MEAPWFTCVFTVSRHWDDDNWKGEVGRVDELIRKYGDAWGCNPQNTIAYLCGHPEMVEHGKGILRRAGYQKESLREEVYWVPTKAA
jgi:ferredoxin/flavodoxin---NADP+ reductase